MLEQILIIKDNQKKIIAVGTENEKGFRKSIEQSELWCLHPDTGKLIPFAEFGDSGPLLEIVKKDAWYEAALDISSGESPSGPSMGGDNKAGKQAPDISGVEILDTLAGVIRGRHEQMPEGSYTTHLFSSGEEKIRKKTGEEAVELILARDEDEIVYESADLIYHMLVLLESKGIPLSRVLQELAKRAK